MKKILIGVGVLVIAALAAAYLNRDSIGMMLAFQRLEPKQPFAESPQPAAPDYSLPASWAALPDRQDDADVVPSGDVQDVQASAEVDVFFVHPTTFFGTAAWNQSLDDAATNQLTDKFVLRGQASVFNSCCRVYAPRYRQATIFSFLDRSGSGASGSSTRTMPGAFRRAARACSTVIGRWNSRLIASEWPTRTGTRTVVGETRRLSSPMILRVSRTIFHSSSE